MRRRGFLLGLAALGGGGLAVGWAGGAPDLTGSREIFNTVAGETALNGWVRIRADGSVTVAVPRAEMGQGVSSALAAMVAEELDVPWEHVRVELPPQDALYANTTMLLDASGLVPDAEQGHWTRWLRQLAANGLRASGLVGTGGSSSVRDAWLPMRSAGAAARTLLVEAAAARWQVEAGSCRTASGRVEHVASGRSAGYGELASAAARGRLAGAPALRPPAAWRLLGTSFARLDVPAKVAGTALFGIDIQPSKCLFAAVRLAPQPGGELIKVLPERTLAEPGVEAVVTIPGGVAVVADRWWRARRALGLLEVEFSVPDTRTSDAALRERYLALARDGAAQVHVERGDQTAARAATGSRVVEVDYRLPFLAHATLEPMNCTARIADGLCEVWMGHQIPTLLRWFAAHTAGIDSDRVVFHPAPLGGGFGRRAEVDLVIQAVTVAARVPGRPVKLIWDRPDDLRHDMYRPMALVRQRVAVDAQGFPLAWHYRVVTPSIVRSMMERMLPVAANNWMPDKTAVDGARDLPYAVAALCVEHVPAPAGLPVGIWRGVGHSINAFAVESLIDELALAARQDPLLYRAALLAQHPRHLAVLHAAARAAAWGAALPAGSGRGLAVHAAFGSILAAVVEVELDAGRIRVRRITAAVDCGTALHPDNVRAQVEGGMLFGLGAALQNRISVADGAVRESNFHDYPCLRMADTPAVEVLIVDTPGAAIGGIGEVGVPPVAPALANAVVAAGGRRLRELPLGAGIHA